MQAQASGPDSKFPNTATADIGLLAGEMSKLETSKICSNLPKACQLLFLKRLTSGHDWCSRNRAHVYEDHFACKTKADVTTCSSK